MNQKSPSLLSFLFTFLLIILPVLISMAQNDISVLYLKVGDEEIQKVLDNWKDRQIKATDWFVVFETQNAGRTEYVVEYRVNEITEYALISIPVTTKDSLCGNALMIYLHGGQEGVSFKKINSLYSLLPENTINQTVIIAPAFRGEPILAYGQKFISQTEKSLIDYDADDVLALLNLSFENIPYLNPDRIFVFGISRGANTALRVAARYPGLNKVVAVAPFTNVFHPDVIKQLGALGHKTVEAKNILQELHNTYLVPFYKKRITSKELRYELLLRSPGYFYKNFPKTIIIHGTEDPVVPYSQSLWLDSLMNSNPEPSLYASHFLQTIQGGGHAKLDAASKTLLIKEFRKLVTPELIYRNNELYSEVRADSFQWYFNKSALVNQKLKRISAVNPGIYRLLYYEGKCQYFSKPFVIKPLKR